MSKEGLTTDNLSEFKEKEHKKKVEGKMKDAVQGYGEVNGKGIKWDYSQGKFSKK